MHFTVIWMTAGFCIFGLYMAVTTLVRRARRHSDSGPTLASVWAFIGYVVSFLIALITLGQSDYRLSAAERQLFWVGPGVLCLGLIISVAFGDSYRINRDSRVPKWLQLVVLIVQISGPIALAVYMMVSLLAPAYQQKLLPGPGFDIALTGLVMGTGIMVMGLLNLLSRRMGLSTGGNPFSAESTSD